MSQRALVFIGDRRDDTVITKKSGINTEHLVNFFSCLKQYHQDNLDFAGLTRDQIMISSLLNICSPTLFINNCGKNNSCKPGQEGKFEKEGIFSGIIAPRLDIAGEYDWRQLMITKQQNTKNNGYGTKEAPVNTLMKTFVKLYGIDNFPTYDEVEERIKKGSTNYLRIKISNNENGYLDLTLYQKRMQLTFIPMLLMYNKIGDIIQRSLFLRTASIGTGEYLGALKDLNTDLIKNLNTIQINIIKNTLVQHQLIAIKHVTFNWFGGHFTNPGTKETFADHIDLNNEQRITWCYAAVDLAVSLPTSHADYFLAVNYPWDGNAYPGNEYWLGGFALSLDPAAASGSLIGEIQNPDINPAYLNRIVPIATAQQY